MNAPYREPAIGRSVERVDGRAKVTGSATYAYEHPLAGPLFVHVVSSTIARGRVRKIDDAEARALEGVVAVMTHDNAPRLASKDDLELWVLQSPKVTFRGQIVAAVIAGSAEIARHAASLVRVEYTSEPHDAELRLDHESAGRFKRIKDAHDTDDGDVVDGLNDADVVVDRTYVTPMEHNNPMEPHTAVAIWADRTLTFYASTQGVHALRDTLSEVFGVAKKRIRVISPYVGGGFGSKGTAHAHDVLAGLAAQVAEGRPVKLALTRQQTFDLAGHRAPTVQRVRLGADREGRLTAIVHETLGQVSRTKVFAEQASVPSRMMYEAPNRRTTHRYVTLDLPVATWMRAPGEAPGMFALEAAMDELAFACGVDPIELRARNDPPRDPESGRPWSSRRLVECLREGARRFGWEARAERRGRRDGRWQVGTGVASATYPHWGATDSRAEIVVDAERRFVVRIGAADLGTGAWTALTQIAADTLGCALDEVRLEIGDSALPEAGLAGGSTGLTGWGSAIHAAATAFRNRYGRDVRMGDRVIAKAEEPKSARRFAIHSFGAHFAEVRVDADTGEVRVPRMLGVFSVGRIVNPRTARSQLVGGMAMGLSMALHEKSVLDPRFGHVVNRDLAGYHVAGHADVRDVEAVWLDEEDLRATPVGTRGLGEIGIVGAAASIVNAIHDATGIRCRELPVTPDRLLPALLADQA